VCIVKLWRYKYLCFLPEFHHTFSETLSTRTIHSSYNQQRMSPITTKFKALVLVSTSLASAFASGPAGGSDVDFSQHPWIAPGPNDVRGPCPGLNTYVQFPHRFLNLYLIHAPVPLPSSLANHGFLPRDGRNLTVSNVLKAGSGSLFSSSLL
jgi:hypothetical protein